MSEPDQPQAPTNPYTPPTEAGNSDASGSAGGAPTFPHLGGWNAPQGTPTAPGSQPGYGQAPYTPSGGSQPGPQPGAPSSPGQQPTYAQTGPQPTYGQPNGAPQTGEQPSYSPSGSYNPGGYSTGTTGYPPPASYNQMNQATKKSPTIPLIIGAAVAFVLMIIVAAVVVVSRLDSDSSSSTTAGGGGSETAASKPSDAVRGYLEALSAGDADRALSYLSAAPADKTLLTSEALKASSAAGGGISNINVPDVDSEYTTRVSTSYTLGDQQVTEDFAVTETGGNWRVERGVMDLDLSLYKARTLGMRINATDVSSNKVYLFPGQYTFTTKSKYITYGDTATMTVTGPSAYYSAPILRPTLTTSGETAAIKAIKAALTACVSKKELKPAGCPNQIGLTSGQKVTPSTIKWSFKGDPVANARVSLDYSNPSMATAHIAPDFTLQASGTQNGQAAEFTEGYTYFRSIDPTVDMSKTPLTATL